MIFLDHFNYEIAIFLAMVGLYIVVSRGNLVKKVAGLNIFQTSVFILYISMGVVTGGSVPILTPGVTSYSKPGPHGGILTAIGVGVSTTAVALSLIIRIKEAYGTIEEEEIHQQDQSF